MARRYGDQSCKPGDDKVLADELADVLWVLSLANMVALLPTALLAVLRYRVLSMLRVRPASSSFSVLTHHSTAKSSSER